MLSKLKAGAFPCFIATLFLLNSARVDASKNYIQNPGFEDVKQPPYAPYGPWSVENDYPAPGISRGSYNTYPKACNQIAKLVSPGDKSKHALQLRACEYVQNKDSCYSQVDAYQVLHSIPEDSKCSMAYRYRIPEIAGKHGQLHLATTAGFSDSSIAVSPNSTWQTLDKLAFTASGYDFFIIQLQQLGNCSSSFEPLVKLEVDNVRVTCAKSP